MEKFAKDHNLPFRYINVWRNKDGKKCTNNDHNTWSIEEINKNPGNKATSNYLSLYIKYTDIFCLDLDQKVIPDQIKFIKDICPYTITNGGEHYYFISKIDNYKQETDVFKDFKGDLIHYKKNIWEAMDRQLNNYTGTIPTISFDQLKPLLNLEKMNFEIAKVVKKTTNHVTHHTTNHVTNNVTNNNAHIKKPVDLNILKRIVFGLSVERSISYDTWSPIVWAIFNISNENKYPIKGRRLIHMFSKQAGAEIYDENRVEEYLNKNTYYKESGKNIGTLCEALLMDNPGLYKEIFKKKDKSGPSYEEVKKEFEKKHFKLISPACYCEENHGDIIMKKKPDMMLAYENIYYIKDGKEMQFLKSWFMDKNIRTYDIMDFIPSPLKVDNKIYNLYTGFEVEKYKYIAGPSNIKPLLDHMYILSGKDDEMCDYFIKWLAQLVQYPGIKTGVAILQKSIQGVGKNIFWDFVGTKILGEKYYYSTSESKRLIGRFANGLNNRLLVNLDEVNGKDTFEMNDYIKNYITADIIPYEKKGVDVIKLRNYARWILTSNNETPIKIELTDRRFVCCECDGELANNIEYFKILRDCMDDPKNQYDFYKFLMDQDISKVDWVNDRPKTKYYTELRSVNIPLVARFLDYFIMEEYIGDKIKAMKLYEIFCKWIKVTNNKGDYSNTRFGREIVKYDGITKIRNNDGVFYNIKYKKIKKYLKNKYDLD